MTLVSFKTNNKIKVKAITLNIAQRAFKVNIVPATFLIT
jgi:hypothetical protein